MQIIDGHIIYSICMQEAQKEKPIPQTTTPILSSPVEVEQDNVIVSTPVEQDNAESLGVAVSQGTTDQEQDVTFLNSTSESQENSTHLLQQDIPRPTPVIPQTVPELQQSSHKKPVQKPRHEPSLMQHGQNVRTIAAGVIFVAVPARNRHGILLAAQIQIH